MPALVSLPLLCKLRKEASYGIEHSYFDHPVCAGWTREGEDDVPHSGCAVVISNGDPGNKRMFVGKRHIGKTFVDALGHETEEILIDERGEAEFYCPGGSLSVWVDKGILGKLEL
jgi:alpha-amylase